MIWPRNPMCWPKLAWSYYRIVDTGMTQQNPLVPYNNLTRILQWHHLVYADFLWIGSSPLNNLLLEIWGKIIWFPDYKGQTSCCLISYICKIILWILELNSCYEKAGIYAHFWVKEANIHKKIMFTLFLFDFRKKMLSTNRGRNSVTIQRRCGEVTAPIKSSIFGCRSFFISDTLKNKASFGLWIAMGKGDIHH